MPCDRAQTILRRLILAQAQQHRLSQMTLVGELLEAYLADQLGAQPLGPGWWIDDNQAGMLAVEQFQLIGKHQA